MATTNSPATNGPRQRRRWYQFSLRTLIVLMVVLSVLLGALAVRLQRARRQAEAVAVIRKSGECWYDYIQTAERSPLPSWLISAVGEDFFHDVTSVSLNFRDSSAKSRLAAYKALEQLDQVETLGICDFDENGIHEFAVLSRLPRLYHLEIETRRLQDFHANYLKSIEGLPKLERVRVPASVGKEGVRSLTTLPNLAVLELIKGVPLGDEVTIDDATFLEIANCKSIEMLGLIGVRVSDDALEEFTRRRPDVEIGGLTRD